MHIPQTKVKAQFIFCTGAPKYAGKFELVVTKKGIMVSGSDSAHLEEAGGFFFRRKLFNHRFEEIQP